MGVSMHGSTIEDRDGRTGGGGSGGGGAGGNGGGSSPGGGNWSAPETHISRASAICGAKASPSTIAENRFSVLRTDPIRKKCPRTTICISFPRATSARRKEAGHYDVHGAVANTSLPNTIIFREASFRMLR